MGYSNLVNAIVDLYQQLNYRRPLQGTDQADRDLYVDWQQYVGGDDVKLRMVRGIARSSQPVTQLFTGPRGAGKTTELNRVRHILEEGSAGKRFFVSMMMAEEWLNLSDIQPEEFGFEIIRQLITDLRGLGFRPNGIVKDFFRKLGGEFNKKLGLDSIEVGHDPLKLTFKSKDIPPSHRRKFQELLQGNLPKIYDLVNDQVIAEARRWLAENKQVEDMLVIVDEADRIPLLGSNHEELFIGRAGMLRALDCHVLYTIPIDLAYSSRRAALNVIYGAEILALHVMPILDSAGNVNLPARNAILEVANRRAKAANLGLEDIFDSEELLKEVLSATGGHIRTLLVLLRSMLDRVDNLPITESIVLRTLRGTAADLARPLSRNDWTFLEEVHATKRRVHDSDSPSWYRLLRDSYILPYCQEEIGYWYDWNPLLNYCRHLNRL
jgi:hypothetical protein